MAATVVLEGTLCTVFGLYWDVELEIRAFTVGTGGFRL